MSRYFIPIAIAFQAVSVISFMVNATPWAVVLFGVATAGEMFLVWMDRKKLDQVDEIKRQIAELNAAVSTVSMKIQSW